MTNVQLRDRVEELEAVLEQVCDELDCLRQDLREALGYEGEERAATAS